MVTASPPRVSTAQKSALLLSWPSSLLHEVLPSSSTDGRRHNVPHPLRNLNLLALGSRGNAGDRAALATPRTRRAPSSQPRPRREVGRGAHLRARARVGARARAAVATLRGAPGVFICMRGRAPSRRAGSAEFDFSAVLSQRGGGVKSARMLHTWAAEVREEFGSSPPRGDLKQPW